MSASITSLTSANTACRCPFLSCATDGCQVCLATARPGHAKTLALCATEDHDSCPLFLSKMLRHSHSIEAGRTFWPMRHK